MQTRGLGENRSTLHLAQHVFDWKKILATGFTLPARLALQACAVTAEAAMSDNCHDYIKQTETTDVRLLVTSINQTNKVAARQTI